MTTTAAWSTPTSTNTALIEPLDDDTATKLAKRKKRKSKKSNDADAKDDDAKDDDAKDDDAKGDDAKGDDVKKAAAEATTTAPSTENAPDDDVPAPSSIEDEPLPLFHSFRRAGGFGGKVGAGLVFLGQQNGAATGYGQVFGQVD